MAHVGSQPIYILGGSSQRTSGRDARRSNVLAARAVDGAAEAVELVLRIDDVIAAGPLGGDGGDEDFDF